MLYDYQPSPSTLAMQELAVPQPGAGEVRVRIAFTPINPSDLMFMQGKYGVRKKLPVVPGFEASGTIEALGEGVTTLAIGQRVACFAGEGSGTWADLMITRASLCFPLPNAVELLHGAMMLVNPLSAYAMIALARAHGAGAFVQSAAASALGKMLIPLAAQAGIETINIVRRESQIEAVQAAGGRYILNSAEPTFEKHLREVCRQLKPPLAFDAVGGDLSGMMLRCLPNHAALIVYGGLDGMPAAVDVDQVIFRGKTVSGFWLPVWMNAQTADSMAAAWQAVTTMFGADAARQPTVRRLFPLEYYETAISMAQSGTSAGKVLFSLDPLYP
jgi:NADPH:quinone reductase